MLQPAQAEVVLGQLSTYLAPWVGGMRERGGGEGMGGFVHVSVTCYREWDSKGGVNSETR
jgi:hypothetical protein